MTETLKREFEQVQATYKDIMTRMIKMKIPATLEPSAAACNVGEWCCTGTERVRDRMQEVVLPGKLTRR